MRTSDAAVQADETQKFVSVYANIHNHFNAERHLVDRPTYKALRSVARAEWRSFVA